MVYVTKDAGVKSFHDDADRDVELYEGGSLMAFPDNCDLGSDFYLISKKKGGGLEFGRGGHDYTQVLPIETQDEIADDISDCMDDMADWVNEGRLNFAEEFRYQAGLSYSEAGIIFDGRTDKIKLYKDILEEDRDKPPHLKAAVESMDSYVEDGDNSTLYQAEFAKAQKDWARYKYDRQYEDPYYTKDETVKNIGSYARYEYDSIGLKLVGGLVGGSILGAFFLINGPMTSWRDGAYKQRKEDRQEKIKDIKALAKHKPLDF
jgi:hypothetical protein